MKTDGIIFDLDGTLWDSSESILVAWNLRLEEKKVNKKLDLKELHGYLGLPMDVIFERMLTDYSKDEQTEIGMDLCEFENTYISEHGGVLFEGVEETLGELSKKVPLMIVSNCQEGYIQAFLKAHKLGSYFVDFESFGNTRKSKAENIAQVVRRNKLKNPVYVGDIQGDSDSAHKAGVPIIYAEFGFGEIVDAEASIKTFPELIQILNME